MLRQARLDLPKLDPEAADLHLVVVATEELDVAVGQVTTQVARTVEPVALHEGAGEEALGGELWTVQIPPRHACAADVDLPDRPKRYGLHPLAKDIDPRVRYRTTNGDEPT